MVKESGFKRVLKINCDNCFASEWAHTARRLFEDEKNDYSFNLELQADVDREKQAVHGDRYKYKNEWNKYK